MYKLKNNAADFAVVDGKFAGRTYRAGEIYDEIPPEEKGKFEKITVIASGEKQSQNETAATTARSDSKDKGGQK